MHYLFEGNYEEAILAFTTAIEIDTKRAEAYMSRGNAYIGSGETEENLTAAQTDYEQAIAMDKASDEAYLGLVDVYIPKTGKKTLLPKKQVFSKPVRPFRCETEGP